MSRQRLRHRKRRPRAPWYLDPRHLWALRIVHMRSALNALDAQDFVWNGEVGMVRGVIFYRSRKRPEELKRPRDKKRARREL